MPYSAAFMPPDQADAMDDAAAREQALIHLDRYWGRVRLLRGGWYGVQLVVALAIAWFCRDLSGSFSLFCLGGAGYLAWYNGRRLRPLLAGFIVSRRERDRKRWQVAVSDTRLFFRCEGREIAVDKAEIRAAQLLSCRAHDAGVTDVVILSLGGSPDACPPPPPYRTDTPAATTPGLRPLLIPATASGFDECLAWLKAEVPFERRGWPA
jgi:hypothetical protein